MWIPGHGGFEGFEKEEELARVASNTHFIGPEPHCSLLPFLTKAAGLNEICQNETPKYWKETPGQTNHTSSIERLPAHLIQLLVYLQVTANLEG